MSSPQPSSNGLAPNPAAPPASTWLRWTVREFFTQVNWSDQTPEVQAIQISALQGNAPALSLQLTVSQFFAAMPWDGKAPAAPFALAAPPPTSPDPSSSFTVDDFADFF